MTSYAGRNCEITEAEAAEIGKREGTVFNIQRHSIHDGPGIRTVLFLKGCPLSCRWCSNPESQSFAPELSFNPEKCIGCGACLTVCPTGAAAKENGAIKFLAELCVSCGACSEVCYAEARVLEGYRISAAEAAAELLKDAPFFSRSGGGVTLSGGEPLAQSAFAEAVLRLCRGGHATTAVETSGCVDWEAFERVLPHTDLFLFDVKHLDSEKHERFIGAGNQKILANLRRLAGAAKAVVLRTPLIPGFNDDAGFLASLTDLALELGLGEIDLLPYHRYGAAKYRLFRRPYPMGSLQALSEEAAEDIAAGFRGKGVKIKIGG